MVENEPNDKPPQTNTENQLETFVIRSTARVPGL